MVGKKNEKNLEENLFVDWELSIFFSGGAV
jgi:hypothetical protein